MSATDLDGRIAGVLQRTKALPDDVAALLAEVEAAVTKTGDELARARTEAFDPMSTTAAVASAQGRNVRRRIQAWASRGGGGSLAREACGGARAG